MVEREPEGRALGAGKKEPADSWRGGGPHRAINLEGFGPILMFAPDHSSIPASELSQVLSISTAGNNYSPRKRFRSIKSGLSSKQNLLTSGQAARQTAIRSMELSSR